MKEFLNSADSLVLDSLEGLISTYPHLGRLDGFPHVKLRPLRLILPWIAAE